MGEVFLGRGSGCGRVSGPPVRCRWGFVTTGKPLSGVSGATDSNTRLHSDVVVFVLADTSPSVPLPRQAPPTGSIPLCALSPLVCFEETFCLQQEARQRLTDERRK